MSYVSSISNLSNDINEEDQVAFVQPDGEVCQRIVQQVKSYFQTPKIHFCIMSQSFTERCQPGRLFFYDNSHRLIGRQSFANRLTAISKKIKFKWTENTLNVHQLRMKLKSTFFSYAKPILVEQEVFPPGGAL